MRTVSDDQLFLAGDVRQRNIELTSLQTRLRREHNRIAAGLALKNPSAHDEQLYQRARQQVIPNPKPSLQRILPALLGKSASGPLQRLRPHRKSRHRQRFSPRFRLGHSMLGDDVEFLDNTQRCSRCTPPCQCVLSILMSSRQPASTHPQISRLGPGSGNRNQVVVAFAISSSALQAPAVSDLASLNIQRGATTAWRLQTTRVASGWRPSILLHIIPITAPENSADSTAPLTTRTFGRRLAEDHIAGAKRRPLFDAIISDQSSVCAMAIVFWYQNDFSGPQLDTLNHTHLSDIIRRNTTRSPMFQDNVSSSREHFRSSPTMQPQHPARIEAKAAWLVERPTPRHGWQYLQTTTTNSQGQYSFTGLDLGTYRVRVVARMVGQTTKIRRILAARGGNVLESISFQNSTQPSPNHWMLTIHFRR